VPLIPAFERLTHGSPSQNQGHVILIISMSVVLSSVLQAMVDRHELRPHGRAGRYLAALDWALIGIYLAAAAVFVAGAIVFGTDLRRAIWSRITVGHFLFAHYYFQEAVGIFVAMFLTRAAIVWLYHRRQFAAAWGSTAMLILIVLDFQLVLRTWYPFTNLDARYAPDWPPNSFVLRHTTPLDRVGASQFQDAAAAHDAALAAFVREPAPLDYGRVADRFERMYYAGFKKPLFEPGFSYFPLTALRSFYGYHESLMPAYFWQFDAALNRADPRYERGSFIGVWDPHSRLLDVAGIRYLFWHEPVADPRLIEVGRYPNDGRIYENQRAVPRAYVVPTVEIRGSERDTLERLQSPSFDPRAAVVTEDPALLTAMADADRSAAGDARITHYEPDRVAIEVVSSARAVLVLNDMFHPNWTATVNGAAAPIYRVNGAFRGVVVPAGSATVEFRYRNRLFRAGIALSSAGWATTAAVLAFGFRRSRLVAVPARALS
jgi:membrane protein YfhO